ncbi:hypothetical protein NP493_289g02003 [Ridgeia piscesae]|uniref:Alpha-1,3-mannosyl-glycoprotein 4-beta-N-acetylglucosaminyltransferase C n=1 Tax=Ridgeia piscesae TaxID=27915 RepID=A0AAD9NWK3_RIDPI|nr:hypothetical protein NP493_289g02003 [Ridgeia piscesae]
MAEHDSKLTHTSGATLFHVTPRYVNVIAKHRPKEGFLTIGIPSIKRPTGDVYVLDTIQSILNATSQTDRDRVVAVVFLTDFDVAYNTRLSAAIVERYGRHIDSGLIHVVQVARDVYPPLDGLKRNFNDAKERVSWRAKQNVNIRSVLLLQVVDFALMFLYAPNVSRYYIQIEDDVKCANGFVPSIERFLTSLAVQHRNWTLVDFSTLGFIGKLLRSTDLRTFAQFLLLFYQEQPVDFLINMFRMAMVQRDVILCRPTLFQHVGLKSSLRVKAAKDNKLKDKYFDDGTNSQPNNPSAVVASSMTAHKGYHPQDAYSGDKYFWAQDPRNGSTVDVTFSTPVRLHRVVVTTGNSAHPNDTLRSGVLEACAGPRRTTASCFQLGHFVNGSVDANVSPSTAPVRSLRVRVTRAQDTWIIFRSIAVYENLSAAGLS